MRTAELLTEAYGRIAERVHDVLSAKDGSDLDPADLAFRPAGRAGAPAGNSIAWLVWHLTRVQDDHIAEVAGRQQVWLEEDFVARFALPFEPAATGYGQTSVDVDELGVAGTGAAPLREYHDAVHARTLEFVAALSDADLDRIVDERWDPPVSLGVRLVSVLDDDLEHVAQAAYVRGLLGH
ncbi:mycothiol transferase [Nakamurella leprariae]|uniref:DinB family protein n=1 Tax=Nakamurella leprariae TaxID=2803911 RepID=A0A938YE96_9ACTN|nr:DinB family protein [Nakamurella leprariae]MBM9466837.1 DinB family protein [Nakamurella leprariae]